MAFGRFVARLSKQPLMNTDADHIVLFDGVCNLCNASVKFIIRYDCKKKFRFASLQSASAQKLLKAFQTVKISDSVLYIENGILYQESTAALKIARHLCWFSWFSILLLIPTWFRDPIYRLIARKRYNWFGKLESCMLPDEEDKSLFL
jgi:predicted DCC family thiol-disulfide oxidoreductase YuxK